MFAPAVTASVALVDGEGDAVGDAEGVAAGTVGVAGTLAAPPLHAVAARDKRHAHTSERGAVINEAFHQSEIRIRGHRERAELRGRRLTRHRRPSRSATMRRRSPARGARRRPHRSGRGTSARTEPRRGLQRTRIERASSAGRRWCRHGEVPSVERARSTRTLRRLSQRALKSHGDPRANSNLTPFAGPAPIGHGSGRDGPSRSRDAR